MSFVSNITRRLSQLAVRQSGISNTNKLKLRTTSNIQQLPRSTFSTKDESDSTEQQWDAWQKSLLNGTNNNSTKNKRRGGKTQRKKAVAQSLSSQERLLDGAGPGQFPPLRYPDEETEMLLKQAYSHIPERAGKIGTRRKKRMKNKFHGIRKARSIKKAEKLEHHFDRMDKRSFQVEGIKKMKELSKDIRFEDQVYQMTVLKKWAEISGVAISSRKSEVLEGGDDLVSAGEK